MEGKHQPGLLARPCYDEEVPEMEDEPATERSHQIQDDAPCCDFLSAGSAGGRAFQKCPRPRHHAAHC
jgi:hypothetical protein